MTVSMVVLLKHGGVYLELCSIFQLLQIWLASVHPWLAIQLDYGYDGELSSLFKFVLFQDWWAESFFANHFISQISFDLHRTCIARWNIPINCIKALLIQNHLGHFIPCSICIDVSIRSDWALLFGCLQVHIN